MRVVLFVGGLSVSVLMLSKLAQGLFHRAICQSGVYGTVALRDKSQAAEELKTFLREQANGQTAGSQAAQNIFSEKP